MLGRDIEDDKYKMITDYADSIILFQKGVSFDIPTQYGCIRFWGREPITIDNNLNLSTILEELPY